MSRPLDRRLYEQVKREVKQRVSVWPSAYASGQLVREYKKRGGRYASSSSVSSAEKRSRGHRNARSGYTRSTNARSRKGSGSGNLGRWFKEEWVNVCEKDSRGRYKRCGSYSSRGRSLSRYPYCRPLRRVSAETPRTVGEMSKSELSSMCQKKRRSMVRSGGKQTRVYQKGARVARSSSSSHEKGGLPRGTRFVRGPGKYKYTAILPDGKRVNFGHRDYQHYRDSVPRSMGGGLWSSKDHGNQSRRENYRRRHSGVRTKSGERAYLKKYSPSWFSYHYLW